MTVDCRKARCFELFASLDKADLKRLLDQATPRMFGEGETVFAQGAPATHFFVLESGRLKVAQITRDGEQVVVRVVNPGDLFGIANALRRPDYPGTAVAATKSSVLAWPMALWPRFVSEFPAFGLGAIQTMGSRLEEAHARIREISTEAVEQRIAHAVLRLLEQAGRESNGGTLIDFPISRQDIAEMTGSTLHTVSRTLSAWEALGVVELGRRKLKVRDTGRLAAIADAAG